MRWREEYRQKLCTADEAVSEIKSCYKIYSSGPASQKAGGFEYPSRYCKPWAMRNNKPVIIRPITARDESRMIKFHKTLSDQSVYSRYFSYMKLSTRISHDRLLRICSMDPKNEMVLVALCRKPECRKREILAVGRLSKIPRSLDAEMAILVGDQHQGNGLGTEVMNRLLHSAHRAGLMHVIAEVLPDNTVMQRINRKLDFPVRSEFRDGTVRAIFTLSTRTQDSILGYSQIVKLLLAGSKREA